MDRRPSDDQIPEGLEFLDVVAPEDEDTNGDGVTKRAGPDRGTLAFGTACP